MSDAPTADGGPGFLAFLAFFLLALALWFLMRNMNARMRRMSYRQQAAHRGKDEAQATPEDLASEPDGPVGIDPRRRGRRVAPRPGVAGRRCFPRRRFRPRRPGLTPCSGGRGSGEGQRGGDEVRREREDGQRVEHLVEPEPAR